MIRLLAGLCAAGSLMLPVRPAEANEYRYPAGSPVLAINLPDDWPTNEQSGPAKLLLCSPPDDSTYTISVMSLPTTGSGADLGELLTRITKAGAAGAGLTDIKVSAAKETMIGKGTRVFTVVTASGKHDEEEGAFTYYAFRLPGTGMVYAVGVAGFQVMIEAHKAEFEAVAESIRSVK